MRSILLAAALIIAAPALAQDAATNALRDAARAQEKQAETLRQIERNQRDQMRAEDRARRNAARDSRSINAPNRR